MGIYFSSDTVAFPSNNSLNEGRTINELNISKLTNSVGFDNYQKNETDFVVNNDISRITRGQLTSTVSGGGSLFINGYNIIVPANSSTSISVTGLTKSSTFNLWLQLVRDDNGRLVGVTGDSEFGGLALKSGSDEEWAAANQDDCYYLGYAEWQALSSIIYSVTWKDVRNTYAIRETANIKSNSNTNTITFNEDQIEINGDIYSEDKISAIDITVPSGLRTVPHQENKTVMHSKASDETETVPFYQQGTLDWDASNLVKNEDNTLKDAYISFGKMEKLNSIDGNALTQETFKSYYEGFLDLDTYGQSKTDKSWQEFSNRDEIKAASQLINMFYISCDSLISSGTKNWAVNYTQYARSQFKKFSTVLAYLDTEYVSALGGDCYVLDVDRYINELVGIGFEHANPGTTGVHWIRRINNFAENTDYIIENTLNSDNGQYTGKIYLKTSSVLQGSNSYALVAYNTIEGVDSRPLVSDYDYMYFKVLENSDTWNTTGITKDSKLYERDFDTAQSLQGLNGDKTETAFVSYGETPRSMFIEGYITDEMKYVENLFGITEDDSLVEALAKIISGWTYTTSEGEKLSTDSSTVGKQRYSQYRTAINNINAYKTQVTVGSDGFTMFKPSPIVAAWSDTGVISNSYDVSWKNYRKSYARHNKEQPPYSTQIIDPIHNWAYSPVYPIGTYEWQGQPGNMYYKDFFEDPFSMSDVNRVGEYDRKLTLTAEKLEGTGFETISMSQPALMNVLFDLSYDLSADPTIGSWYSSKHTNDITLTLNFNNKYNLGLPNVIVPPINTTVSPLQNSLNKAENFNKRTYYVNKDIYSSACNAFSVPILQLSSNGGISSGGRIVFEKKAGSYGDLMNQGYFESVIETQLCNAAVITTFCPGIIDTGVSETQPVTEQNWITDERTSQKFGITLTNIVPEAQQLGYSQLKGTSLYVNGNIYQNVEMKPGHHLTNDYNVFARLGAISEKKYFDASTSKITYGYAAPLPVPSAGNNRTLTTVNYPNGETVGPYDEDIPGTDWCRISRIVQPGKFDSDLIYSSGTWNDYSFGQTFCNSINVWENPSFLNFVTPTVIYSNIVTITPNENATTVPKVLYYKLLELPTYLQYHYCTFIVQPIYMLEQDKTKQPSTEIVCSSYPSNCSQGNIWKESWNAYQKNNCYSVPNQVWNEETQTYDYVQYMLEDKIEEEEEIYLSWYNNKYHSAADNNGIQILDTALNPQYIITTGTRQGTTVNGLQKKTTLYVELSTEEEWEQINDTNYQKKAYLVCADPVVNQEDDGFTGDIEGGHQPFAGRLNMISDPPNWKNSTYLGRIIKNTSESTPTYTFEQRSASKEITQTIVEENYVDGAFVPSTINEHNRRIRQVSTVAYSSLVFNGYPLRGKLYGGNYTVNLYRYKVGTGGELEYDLYSGQGTPAYTSEWNDKKITITYEDDSTSRQLELLVTPNGLLYTGTNQYNWFINDGRYKLEIIYPLINEGDGDEEIGSNVYPMDGCIRLDAENFIYDEESTEHNTFQIVDHTNDSSSDIATNYNFIQKILDPEIVSLKITNLQPYDTILKVSYNQTFKIIGFYTGPSLSHQPNGLVLGKGISYLPEYLTGFTVAEYEKAWPSDYDPGSFDPNTGTPKVILRSEVE